MKNLLSIVFAIIILVLSILNITHSFSIPGYAIGLLAVSFYGILKMVPSKSNS